MWIKKGKCIDIPALSLVFFDEREKPLYQAMGTTAMCAVRGVNRRRTPINTHSISFYQLHCRRVELFR